MKHVLNDLMQSLKKRVDSQFLSSVVLNEMNEVNEAEPGNFIDRERVMQIAIKFLSNLHRLPRSMEITI